MDAKIAAGIAEHAEANGTECSIRSYSGRGMYGDKTTALTFDSLGDFIASVVSYVGELAEDGNSHAVEEVATALSDIRTDNMGRDSIVYY